jgi:hypothetical protein
VAISELPATISYESFAGALPRITEITASAREPQITISQMGLTSMTCIYRGLFGFLYRIPLPQALQFLNLRPEIMILVTMGSNANCPRIIFGVGVLRLSPEQTARLL